MIFTCSRRRCPHYEDSGRPLTMFLERAFGREGWRGTRDSSAAYERTAANDCAFRAFDGLNFTRRQLWMLAILGAFSGPAGKAAYAREFLSPAPPITADAALIRADARDIHADQ